MAMWPQIDPKFGDEKRKSKIRLEVDGTDSGQGPETIRFSNLPAGRYEIVVNDFGSVKEERRSLANARPLVSFRLPSDDGVVTIQCKLKDECAGRSQSKMRIWRVADIDVSAASRKGWYKIRIDANPKMSLVSGDLPTKIGAFVRERDDDGESKKYFAPQNDMLGPDWATDGYLANACQSQCEVFDARFQSCLAV